jgi:long-subunit acyl-CoA synthetase (AMP-forming)
MRQFDLEQYVRNIHKFNATDILVVPAMAVAILRSELAKKGEFLKMIKTCVSVAAPLDKKIQASFRALLNDKAPLTQAWGMTETCCAASMFPYPEDDDTGSVGRMLPNLEAKLVIT